MPENGIAWIKGGKVFVKDPSGTGRLATITPCNGVDLLVNNTRVETKTTVSEADQVSLITSQTEEPGKCEVRLSSDSLTAVLTLKTKKVSRCLVQDMEPQSDLLIKVENRTDRSCPYGMAEIMEEFRQKGVTYGIRNNDIQEVLSRPVDGEYIVAKGDPPGETIDDRVELTFKQDSMILKASDDSEKIDYREMVEIVSVDAGTVLAVKYPGVQGEPGKKVTGDILPPVPPKLIDLVAGKGATLIAEGTRVVAKTSGRPVAKKTGTRLIVDVEPVLYKKGDVDMASGNVRFKGDVVVQGSVSEGMTVQASGKIVIHGMVFDSHIAAQGDITVGQNITGSDIVAGGDNTAFRALNKSLSGLQQDLYEALQAVPALARHPKLQNVKAGQLLQILIDKKYTGVPPALAEMFKVCEQNAFILPREMNTLLEKAGKYLTGLSLLKMESLDVIEELVGDMKEVRDQLSGMAQNKAGISFRYAVNSKIEASGDVRVEGLGCINSSILAGGNIIIKGVFRGGSIVAGGDIILNEAGSELGASTLIKTAAGKRVYIRKSHEGVKIQIDNRLASITLPQHNIKAELNDAGDLIIRPA